MADLAQSAVTIVRAWSEGGVTGKELSCRQVTLVLTTQGGATNKIPASVLSLSKIEQASAFTGDADDLIYVAAPSYDGSFLMLKAAGTNAPADYADTIRGVVKGYL